MNLNALRTKRDAARERRDSYWNNLRRKESLYGTYHPYTVSARNLYRHASTVYMKLEREVYDASK